ncbi:family 1 encapsulin nanocompartment shell protein [Kiritimatiella glycovorans]|uniref:Putative bacteriocin n=1 Tax=Kiritimatiella glycovorans TaxID=1307763 RepID=A0A0G3EGF7_9BACT|nr:family 1 encapsulin nanocompartment shell protein [Kiritimatiella glycovorans]AKJ65551.1 putative bacteriocin [Kiritimatiella glycovorans]
MDNLRKELAPISEEGWQEINEQARRVLRNNLSARRFADVDGPKGWDCTSVSLGRLNVPEKQADHDVRYGVHLVQPLVEARVSFKLKTWELDNAVRGAEDIDLEPLEDAAAKIAAFEDAAVYYGFDAGCIRGLKAESDHKALKWPEKAEDALGTVQDGVQALRAASVEGPYNLVIDAKRWKAVESHVGGYPLRNRIQDALGGKVIVSPNVKNAFLVSGRGGDFRLTLGADLSIGYEGHDTESVQLYLTESFTFQVLDPAAAVVLA